MISYMPKRNAISPVTQNAQGKEKWGHPPNGLPMVDGDTAANSVNEASRGVRGLWPCLDLLCPVPAWQTWDRTHTTTTPPSNPLKRPPCGQQRLKIQCLTMQSLTCPVASPGAFSGFPVSGHPGWAPHKPRAEGQGQPWAQGFIYSSVKMRDAKSHWSAFTVQKGRKKKKSGLKSKVSFGDKDYHATIEQDVSEAAPLSSTRDASPCLLGYCA